MKKTRPVGLAATLMAAALALSACAGSTSAETESPAAESAAPAESAAGTATEGEPQGGEPFKVGVSWDNKSIALIQAWEDYQQQIAQEQGLNFEWVYTVADDDPAKQASNIEDLINQGADVIVARAGDGAAIGSSIKAARDAGVPFVAFDRKPTTETPTAYVGGDSYDQAKTTIAEMVRLFTEANVQGKCIELLGALTDANAVNRSKAFAEADAASDTFEIIQQVPTEWKPELFLSGTANALKANPDANCLLTASDFAFPSIQSALEGAGKWAKIGEPNHMWMGGLDVFPEAYVAMKDNYIDAGTTWDAWAHSQELVKVLKAISEGQDPGCGEEGCLAQGRLATPSTVDSLENVWSRDYNPDGTKKE